MSEDYRETTNSGGTPISPEDMERINRYAIALEKTPQELLELMTAMGMNALTEWVNRQLVNDALVSERLREIDNPPG